MLDREFETQSVDPMFLEPEARLAWYDARRKSLELVVGVQSPYEAAESVAYLLGNAQAAFRPARINSNFAYCGGGFARSAAACFRAPTNKRLTHAMLRMVRIGATSPSPQRGYSWRTIMKARFGMALSMVAGAALGAAAIQALHAQAKPPVYMIAINEVSDQERYAKEYVSPAQKSVKDHGGEYVAAGPGAQVAGNLPHGPVVILRWESMEALQGWRNSPEFQAALKIGEKYAKFNIVAVNGLK
ncbi:MAG TPA: DUF1330 domain-containing protein [Xanthobacteraceae bacterium]